MRRSAVLLTGVAIVAVVATGPAVAQDGDPEATIAALQTRVADLEAQLGMAPEPALSDGAAAQPAEADGMPAGATGTALELIPAGDPGELSVVAVGPFQQGRVPVVVRNNTDETRTSIGLSVEVRDAAGTVSQVPNASQFKPLIVEPGGLALGYVFFEQPVAETDQVTMRATGNDDPEFWEGLGVVGVEVVEFNDLGGRVTGSVRNPAPNTTTDMAYIDIVCFDAAGVPTWSDSGVVDEGIPSGELGAFEFGQFVGIPVSCENYLIGGYTYAKP